MTLQAATRASLAPPSLTWSQVQVGTGVLSRPLPSQELVTVHLPVVISAQAPSQLVLVSCIMMLQ